MPHTSFVALVTQTCWLILQCCIKKIIFSPSLRASKKPFQEPSSPSISEDGWMTVRKRRGEGSSAGFITDSLPHPVLINTGALNLMKATLASRPTLCTWLRVKKMCSKEQAYLYMCNFLQSWLRMDSDCMAKYYIKISRVSRMNGRYSSLNKRELHPRQWITD